MKNNKGFAPALIIIIVLGLLAVGGAYYMGKNSTPAPQSILENNYESPIDQNNATNASDIKPSITISAKLTSFTGNNGMFYAESYGLTKVDVYFIPTGTEVSSSNYLGTMNLISTAPDHLQKWSLSAYSTAGKDGITKEGTILATSIYALGLNGSTTLNKIDYPYTGATDIYNHLYLGKTLSAQFPNIYSEGYYHSQDWKLTTAAGQFSCKESGGQMPGEEKVVKKTINHNLYCVHSDTGAAAGTAYTDYTYISEKYGKLMTVSFTFGEVNCSNYDEPRSSICSNEQIKINNSLDSIVGKVFDSIK